MRRTVEEWAKQKETAWSVCQTHNLAQLWEIGGQCASVLVDSVARRGGRIVQKSYWNVFDLVLSSTRDWFLRELEEHSATWFSMPEGPGPRPSSCSTSTDHRWREKRRRHLLIQENALATNWTCEVYIESLGNFVGEVLFPVLWQPHPVRLHWNMWHRPCSKSWTIWSSNGRIKMLNRGVQ